MTNERKLEPPQPIPAEVVRIMHEKLAEAASSNYPDSIKIEGITAFPDGLECTKRTAPDGQIYYDMKLPKEAGAGSTVSLTLEGKIPETALRVISTVKFGQDTLLYTQQYDRDNNPARLEVLEKDANKNPDFRQVIVDYGISGDKTVTENSLKANLYTQKIRSFLPDASMEGGRLSTQNIRTGYVGSDTVRWLSDNPSAEVYDSNLTPPSLISRLNISEGYRGQDVASMQFDGSMFRLIISDADRPFVTGSQNIKTSTTDKYASEYEISYIDAETEKSSSTTYWLGNGAAVVDVTQDNYERITPTEKGKFVHSTKSENGIYTVRFEDRQLNKSSAGEILSGSINSSTVSKDMMTGLITDYTDRQVVYQGPGVYSVTEKKYTFDPPLAKPDGDMTVDEILDMVRKATPSKASGSVFEKKEDGSSVRQNLEFKDGKWIPEDEKIETSVLQRTENSLNPSAVMSVSAKM